MARQRRENIRNLAIIAHVDHGKTTLVDAMLWQSELFRSARGSEEWSIDSIDLEREKAITAMAKITSLDFRGTRINIVDTPGHADFGGEVQRSLKMVEGIMLVVDASEGPLPQSRFVLRRALEAGLSPLVVVNKIDHPSAGPERVLRELSALFEDLDADERQIDFPVIYTNALRGSCRKEPDGQDETLLPLFEAILRDIPPPQHDPEEALQLLVTMFDYDDYLGRLSMGRVFNGRLAKGGEVAHCRLDGSTVTRALTGLFVYDGVRRVEIKEAGPGEIISVSGLESAAIGETLSAVERPKALHPIKVDDPTIAIVLSVNDSPMAGLEGKYTSSSRLRERLWKEILTNASIRILDTDSPDAFDLAGRDELQLAILIEMMRREGFEFQVGKPRAITRGTGEELQEPMESLAVDFPEEYVGIVTEKAGGRRGRMTKMVNHGSGRVRLEFHMPSRGLIGFRTEFLRDTRGTGIMDHMFDGFEGWQGEIRHRSTGVLVADRPGRATAHAIEHLQPRGAIFVAPGDQVYEGLIVGENSRSNDLEVNIVKEEKPSAAQHLAAAHTVHLIPPRSMGLEQALEFIREDELVEVTPKALRLRKNLLQSGRQPLS
jgi:GTP-binding protein